MPIKINELVVQVKICETNKNVEKPNNMEVNFVSEGQKLALITACLNLLEDREAR